MSNECMSLPPFDECCANCVSYRELKHNFKVGIGYEIANCCTALEKDGFVLQVTPHGMCEMFMRRAGESNE